MTTQETAARGLVHPEWVAGRRLWIDPVMQDLIDKIRFGDPGRGWAGDDQLGVFATETDDGIVWEILRNENGGYSTVARSRPGVVFDERVIDGLVARDMALNPGRDLHAEVIEHNAAIDAAEQAKRQEWMD